MKWEVSLNITPEKENVVYLDCQVEIPNEPGKITRFKKGKSIYIRYAVGRIYNPEKKYNVPDHKTIGKLISEPTNKKSSTFWRNLRVEK